jgi:hypothetical protein
LLRQADSVKGNSRNQAMAGFDARKPLVSLNV